MLDDEGFKFVKTRKRRERMKRPICPWVSGQVWQRNIDQFTNPLCLVTLNNEGLAVNKLEQRGHSRQEQSMQISCFGASNWSKFNEKAIS